MPISVNNALLAGGTDYADPFDGPVTHAVAIPIPMSGLTTAEVDINGVLKPGVPFLRSGALVSGAAQLIFGVSVAPVKVATTNTVGALAAAGTKDVTVAQIATIRRAVSEDNLGRAYTANEVSAFAIAGSLIKLLS